MVHVRMKLSAKMEAVVIYKIGKALLRWVSQRILGGQIEVNTQL